MRMYYISNNLNISQTSDNRHVETEMERGTLNTWLELNKLSLKVDKTRLMIFDQSQKKISKPNTKSNYLNITNTDTFDVLLLHYINI